MLYTISYYETVPLIRPHNYNRNLRQGKYHAFFLAHLPCLHRRTTLKCDLHALHVDMSDKRPAIRQWYLIRNQQVGISLKLKHTVKGVVQQFFGWIPRK